MSEKKFEFFQPVEGQEVEVSPYGDFKFPVHFGHAKGVFIHEGKDDSCPFCELFGPPKKVSNNT